MNSDNEIYQTIRKVVEAQLAPAKIVDLTVREDVDHDDDPILRITIVFDAENDRLDPQKTVGLGRNLREPLEELQEERFPIFYFMNSDEMDGAAA